MKRILCLVLAAVLLLITAGCAAKAIKVTENDHYAILSRDGSYFLSFHDPLPAQKGSGSANGSQSASEPVYFESVAQMKQTIETGKFTEAQLKTIRQNFQRSDNDEVELLNLNKLYDAETPEDLPVTNVYWRGAFYSFGLGNDITSGQMYFYTKSEYQEELQNREEYLAEMPEGSTQQLSERNATQYEYVSSYGIEAKVIAYTYTSGEKILHILEFYNLEESPIGPASSTVPFQIEVLGEDNSTFFQCDLLNMAERPSYEWIQSFGLRPYMQTAVK